MILTWCTSNRDGVRWYHVERRDEDGSSDLLIISSWWSCRKMSKLEVLILRPPHFGVLDLEEVRNRRSSFWDDLILGSSFWDDLILGIPNRGRSKIGGSKMGSVQNQGFRIPRSPESSKSGVSKSDHFEHLGSQVLTKLQKSEFPHFGPRLR